MTYTIFEGNLERLEQKLKRIEGKCRKYNASFHYEVVGEEFRKMEVIECGEKKEKTLRYVIIDVSGFAKVNGWEFVATIDHHEAGNVVRNIIDLDIPDKYFHCEPFCEHCQIRRRRNNTYLIHNVDTNEFKQVGTSCLRDFTGGYDAELAASYIAMYEDLIEGEEAREDSPLFGGSFENYIYLDDVLKMSKSVVANLGFVSSTAAEEQGISSSKSILYGLEDLLNNGPSWGTEWLLSTNVVKYYEDFNDDEYLANLKKYFVESDETSSYMRNMKTIMSSKYCKYNDYGYIVSSVYSYDKAMEKIRREREAEEKRVSESQVSQYVGNIKDKISIQVEEAICVSSYDDNYGGISYLYKFFDVNGNVFMWSTSNCLDLEKVETVTGTVKDHKEYKGLKQTWITRCKVTLKQKVESAHEEYVPDAENAIQELLDYMNIDIQLLDEVSKSFR